MVRPHLLQNERNFDKDDAIPRITWGKYVRQGGLETLGLSIEVNHRRFVDGVHLGRFYEALRQKSTIWGNQTIHEKQQARRPVLPQKTDHRQIWSVSAMTLTQQIITIALCVLGTQLTRFVPFSDLQ